MNEAEVEHLVGLVEDEDLDIAQRQRALIDQVDQAAGRGDDDVEAVRAHLDLAVDRRTAEHDAGADIEAATIILERFGDLRGKLARRRQHQHAARAGLARLWVGGKAHQAGQRERRGLAGAGLGDAAQVATLEQSAGSPAPGSASGVS